MSVVVVCSFVVLGNIHFRVRYFDFVFIGKFRITSIEVKGHIRTILLTVFGGDNNAVKSNQQAIQALDNNNSATIPAINQSNNATTSVTPAPSVVNTNTVTSNTPNNTTNGVSSDTLDQFMQLWLKATPAEREKIRQWIKK